MDDDDFYNEEDAEIKTVKTLPVRSGSKNCSPGSMVDVPEAEPVSRREEKKSSAVALQEVESLKAKLAVANESLSRLVGAEESLQQARRELKRLTEQCATWQDRVASAEAELQRLSQRAESAELSLKTAEQRAQKLSRDLEQLQKNKGVEQQLHSCTDGKDWKGLWEELSRRFGILRSQYDSVERSNKQLQAEVDRLKAAASEAVENTAPQSQIPARERKSNDDFSLIGSIFS